MGCRANITIDQFPKQGEWLGKSCDVCFHYDTSKTVRGLCVRDDAEDPGITIFKLQDGRHVLATECMHTGPA